MNISAENAKLLNIPVDSIDRNPENPRIHFRPSELEELLESIRKHGVQVPISVYKDGHKYVLIDGERRWRCCVKLNKSHIPALIQQKPDTLTNLLLMFNIHALREQWDLLTIALKLPKVIELLNLELKRDPKEREIADRTGLKRSVIRRCKLLLQLPDEYSEMIMDELKRPKSQQKLTEDFFIEMERALTTVVRAMPDLVKSKDRVRDVLIDKYRKGIIQNRTDFRLLAKIARARNVEADLNRASTALTKVFEKNDTSILNAYDESVSDAYSERDLIARITALSDKLVLLNEENLDEQIRAKLTDLLNRIAGLLRVRI